MPERSSSRPTPADPAGTGLARPAGHPRDAARHAGSRDTIGLPVPGLGNVHLSRPQLAYVAGVAVLTAVELVSWPVGLALAAGHLLAADRDSRTLENFGEALEQA